MNHSPNIDITFERIRLTKIIKQSPQKQVFFYKPELAKDLHKSLHPDIWTSQRTPLSPSPSPAPSSRSAAPSSGKSRDSKRGRGQPEWPWLPGRKWMKWFWSFKGRPESGLKKFLATLKKTLPRGRLLAERSGFLDSSAKTGFDFSLNRPPGLTLSKVGSTS